MNYLKNIIKKRIKDKLNKEKFDFKHNHYYFEIEELKWLLLELKKINCKKCKDYEECYLKDIEDFQEIKFCSYFEEVTK